MARDAPHGHFNGQQKRASTTTTNRSNQGSYHPIPVNEEPPVESEEFHKQLSDRDRSVASSGNSVFGRAASAFPFPPRIEVAAAAVATDETRWKEVGDAVDDNLEFIDSDGLFYEDLPPIPTTKAPKYM